MPDTTPVIYAIVSFDREDGGSAHLRTFADPALALAAYQEACDHLYDTSTEEFIAVYADGAQKSVARAGEFNGVPADTAIAAATKFLAA